MVATRGRPESLRRLLDSLAAQTFPSSRFEVVVVVDGADPRTLGVLASAQARDALALRVITTPVPVGPGAARNAGWRAAATPLVAFIDDDCVATPGWLAALAGRAAPGTFVAGPTEPNPAERTPNMAFARTLRANGAGPQYETCNIAYATETLEALGGFDEQYGLVPGGEDTDLAWRAIAAGVRPVTAPDALVLHAVHQLGPVGIVRGADRWSATVRVFRDHPGARAMLYRGVFLNVWHYLLWRSLVALLAPAWLRRFVLSRHLIALDRRARSLGSGASAVPFLLAQDAVEAWSVTRGALRHRTFVL